MDVKDEGSSKIQDFHFQQWFGADPGMLLPTEPTDQGLPADADDHADEMWNDPPEMFGSTQQSVQESADDFGTPHSTQVVSQYNPSHSVTPQPATQPTASPHPQPSPAPATQNIQMYSIVSGPSNGHQQVNSSQPTYYSNGTTYPGSTQYAVATNHAVPPATNGTNYSQTYMAYSAGTPQQVWQANGISYSNGQSTQVTRPINESPVDSMLVNSATPPPPPQPVPTTYTHPQYVSHQPVASASHQSQPQHPSYGYTWTPEQLRAMQQSQQLPRSIPAQNQPQPYRESAVAVNQPQPIQHPRVQQTQSASPMPTMSPTMMHMSGSPAPYGTAYADMFVGSPASYGHSQHSPSNPAAINPQALSQPPPVEPSEPQQPMVNTIYLYKPYMQPQMMDAAPAQTAKKLINLLTAEDTPITDPQTRLWLLTRIRDGAGKEFFKTWANDVDGMLLIKEWLRAATPSKDGKVDAGIEPSEWQDTIMPLLQVIDRLPLGINQLRKSKIGFNILKLAKNPPNGAIRDMASSLETRYRNLMETHQAADDAKSTAGKRIEADSRGVKRKSEGPPGKTAAPAKRVTPPTTPAALSPAAAVAARLKKEKEKEKEARSVGGAVTKETKSDSSFFTDTKPKPIPPKRVLPSFTKKAPPPAGSDVAQPSSRNTFEEALADIGLKPKAGTPVAQSTPETTPGAVTPRPQDPSKKRKRVSFKPEELLVEVRWIEKAIYDDDMDAFGAHHSVRDLDRDEGAAMHKHMVFEELIDWSEPMVIEVPDAQLPERGQQSEEAHTQAEREKTALLAHYQPGAIPPWPTEIPPPAVDDSQTKIMLAGEDIDSLSEKPASVAELLAKINTPAPGPVGMDPPTTTPMFESLKDLGIDPSTFTQMLQQHNIAPVIQPPEPAPPTQPRHGSEWGSNGRMTDGGGPGWNDHGSSSYYDDQRSRFEDRGRGHGRPPRGRGRGGRPDNDRGQKVCYFYPLGKCKYGDQCHNLHVK